LWIRVSAGHIGGRVRKRLRGRDEREVRERLREVSDQALVGNVVFLREQPDLVAQRQPALNSSVAGGIMTSLENSRPS
jgi:hypothetical protein